MLAGKRFAISFLVTALSAVAGQATAQEGVRYYEKDGVTYRESRTVVQRPLVETQLQARERTVYREQVSTGYEPRSRTVYTPVTSYQWQARWHDVINPFKPAYVGYHLVPQTHWEARVENVETPVTRREVIPQREVVDVPVTTRRMVDEEVIRRTVVNSAPGTSGSNGTAVARREVVGGISRLESDPPRTGVNWRPAGNGQ